MEEIASKKRSEARKRHEMLRAAIEAIRAQVVRSQRTLAPLQLVRSARPALPIPSAPKLSLA
jgi:hypothetical protein